jgi:hypothetical protein
MSMENIERVAFEMNRERGICEYCVGTKLEGRGRRGDSKAPEGIAPSPPCEPCRGRGYLWYEKRSSPSTPRLFVPGITDEQMMERWEKRLKLSI